MRAFFKSDSSDRSDRWRRRNGRILWRLIVVLPVLVSLYLLGFLSAAMVSSVGHPGESITLLRSTVRHLFQPNESALEPPQAFQSALSEIETHFYGPLPPIDKLTYTAIDGMLMALGDPYTRFMEPDEFRRMQEDKAVRMIRGPRFTRVTLTIRREGEPHPITITIQRDLVESPTVDVYLDDAENKIYRIWLQNFSEKAPPIAGPGTAAGAA
jgi:hypothetical protein